MGTCWPSCVQNQPDKLIFSREYLIFRRVEFMKWAGFFVNKIAMASVDPRCRLSFDSREKRNLRAMIDTFWSPAIQRIINPFALFWVSFIKRRQSMDVCNKNINAPSILTSIIFKNQSCLNCQQIKGTWSRSRSPSVFLITSKYFGKVSKAVGWLDKSLKKTSRNYMERTFCST